MQGSTGREPKLIAFYLPQFHPIPENDEFWGKGFTEWRNVVRAKPLYRGHYQPHLPADLGFYDLRVPEVREAQAALARQYGIYGFCYYYYWFSGRQLLERPLQEVLTLGKPDLPFCICWANESWSRRWDGSEHELLMVQEHSHETDEQFIQDAIPILKDPRYIRISGKPMLLVYRVDLLPRPLDTVRTWRTVAAANGIPELHLCAVQSFAITDPRPYGFDAAIEFPPHGMARGDLEHQLTGVTLNFSGDVCDYPDTAKGALARPRSEYLLHRGIMVGWDNTARRTSRAFIFESVSPSNYYEWLSALVRDARTREDASEFIFINAWNEWAEGAHLEPDLKYGHAYLKATRQALLDTGPRSEPPRDAAPPVARGPRVSVVIRSHNQRRYIREAIESVESQTYGNLELVVVDDGSDDGSRAIIEQTLSDSHIRHVTFRTQPELGPTASFDRGIMLSTGEYVALLNGDAAFDPKRVETLVQRAGAQPQAFLFTGISFYSCREKRIIPTDQPDSRVRPYADALRFAAAVPTAGFALLAVDLTVTTSNLFFSRALFETLGGFDSQLPLVHGWQFALRAARHVEPEFVPDELLLHRYYDRHGSNGWINPRQPEGQIALEQFMELSGETTLNQLAPTRRNWPLFFDYYCSRVTPWFSARPLTEYLAPHGSTTFEAQPNGRVAHARDDAAIQYLQYALDDDWISSAPLTLLRTQVAERWSVTRSYSLDGVRLA